MTNPQPQGGEIECRRCTECEFAHHHWMQGTGEFEYVCKHCPATGNECNNCHGEGCSLCDQEGVIIARHAPPREGEGSADVELLLDNAACASQERRLLRDDDGNETSLREAVRLNVAEPLETKASGQRQRIADALNLPLVATWSEIEAELTAARHAPARTDISDSLAAALRKAHEAVCDTQCVATPRCGVTHSEICDECTEALAKYDAHKATI